MAAFTLPADEHPDVALHVERLDVSGRLDVGISSVLTSVEPPSDFGAPRREREMFGREGGSTPRSRRTARPPASGTTPTQYPPYRRYRRLCLVSLRPDVRRVRQRGRSCREQRDRGHYTTTRNGFTGSVHHRHCFTCRNLVGTRALCEGIPTDANYSRLELSRRTGERYA